MTDPDYSFKLCRGCGRRLLLVMFSPFIPYAKWRKRRPLPCFGTCIDCARAQIRRRYPWLP